MLCIATALLPARAVTLQAQAATPLRLVCDTTSNDDAAACDIPLSAAPGPQRAVLRVRAVGVPAGGLRPMVTFRATEGVLSSDSVRLNADNSATVIWYRAPSAGSRVGVSASITTASGSAARQFWLVPPKPPVATDYVLISPRGDEVDAHPRSGYEKTALRSELVAEVRELVPVADSATRTRQIGTLTALLATPTGGRDELLRQSRPVAAEACVQRRVVFRRATAGGAVTPDTSIPAYRKHGDRVGCFAYAAWTLGAGPGVYDARAALVGRDTSSLPPVEYRAYARALPRFVAGMAFMAASGYDTKRPAPTTIRRYERPLPGGGTESFDTTLTVGRDSIRSVDRDTRATTMIGVSFAPTSLRGARGVSLVVGVNPTRPADNLYFGFSVLRLFAYTGMETEHLPVDVFAVGDLGRVETLDDPEACRSRGACGTTNRRRIRGWGGVVSVDASSLISDAIKKLAGF